MGVSLALSVDVPIQGYLGIAQNMENCGADAPTGTSEPVHLGRSVYTSTASIRISGRHPLRELCASQDGHCRRLLDQAIYVLGNSPACPFAVSFWVFVSFCFGSCSILGPA